MPLPESIAVKYTEEEAEYLSVRPLVRQTFRIHELVDMILAVTGKDPGRVQQILRSGTTVFHFYRYWWPGFEVGDGELAQLLAKFPDPWPARPFSISECVAVLLDVGPSRAGLLLEKSVASRRRALRRSSLWNCLEQWARSNPPRYETYSYEKRADRFVSEVVAEKWPPLRSELLRTAPRALRKALASAPIAMRLVYLSPRLVYLSSRR